MNKFEIFEQLPFITLQNVFDDLNDFDGYVINGFNIVDLMSENLTITAAVIEYE